MRYLVGVDIGGTSVKLGLIEHGVRFSVLGQCSIPTQSADPAGVFVDRLAVAVDNLVNTAGVPRIDGVGVGCPGLVDPWKGAVRVSPNLPNLAGFGLRDALAGRLELPVEIQNDANAAVLGEYLFSPASAGLKNLILLTLGTGVGGGVVCDGHLLVGADNAATELGHLKVEYNNPAPCGCGKAGCVEAYAGAGGIARMARSLLDGGAVSSLNVQNLNTRDIAQAAAGGDRVAALTLEMVGLYLGRCMALMLETFNPEKIILGGGASAAIEFFRPGIEKALDQCSSFAFTRKRCVIERSAFPDDINVIGATATFLNSHQSCKPI